MSGARYIGTALALGGALVAMSVLSSTPGEAKRAQFKKGHFVGSKAFKQQTGKTPRFTHKRSGDGPTDTWKPPGKDPKDPNIGKLPPIVSQPLPPGTFNPGKLPPGTKLPPVVSSEPLPPGTFDPGKLPPGTKLPPVVVGQPLPPIVSGHKPEGIPVKGPDESGCCDPCEWLKVTYNQTGLARWLDRYRLCLTWLRAS